MNKTSLNSVRRLSSQVGRPSLCILALVATCAVAVAAPCTVNQTGTAKTAEAAKARDAGAPLPGPAYYQSDDNPFHAD